MRVDTKEYLRQARTDSGVQATDESLRDFQEVTFQEQTARHGLDYLSGQRSENCVAQISMS